MILTENFKIEKCDNITSQYIESKLKNIGIVPLRWAIVDEEKDFWVISVSYEKV